MEPRSTTNMSWLEYEQYRVDKGTVVHDAVHGEIRLGPLATQLLRTLPVQSLKHKHQLGGAHYGFPTAEHTRLGHSIGTAFLAAKQLEHLRKMGLAVTPRTMELLEVAALCHDLGHGPFSHTFESMFLRAAGIKGWKHEGMSAKLLEYTVEKYNINMTRQEVQFVQDVINGTRNSKLAGLEAWMFQIVANDKNSIDVDKIDYLLRDSMMAGVKPLCDYRGLLTKCKVVDGDICYEACDQVLADLAALYTGRAMMHRKVYQHVDMVAAEFMVADAMTAAESVLRIREDIHDPEAFIRLDDRLLGEIQRAAARDTQNKDLQRAAAILHRLETKDFYPLVAEAVVPPELVFKKGAEACRMEAADILSHQDSSCMAQLVAEDIRVQSMVIHHCKQAHDPLDSVKLYDSSGITRPASLGASFRPACFMDCQLRVYLARQCQDEQQRAAYTKAILAAVERAIKHQFGQEHPWLAVPSNESACGRSTRFMQDIPTATVWATLAEAKAPGTAARIAAAAVAAPAAAAAVAAPLEVNTPVPKASIVQEWSPQVVPRQLLYPQQQQRQVQEVRGIKRRADGIEYVPASDDEDEGVVDTEAMGTQPSQMSQLEPAPQGLRETLLG